MVSCRETERDWDKDLAEDVKGECETKYGKVLAIKVEKESQVCMHIRLAAARLTGCRARFTSNLTPLNRPRTPSKVSTVVGSVAARSPAHSYRMPSCRHTSDRVGWSQSVILNSSSRNLLLAVKKRRSCILVLSSSHYGVLFSSHCSLGRFTCWSSLCCGTDASLGRPIHTI